MFKNVISGPITGTKIKKNSKIALKPMLSIWYISFCNGSGANAYSNLDPSSGGNGIMLKTKNATFTITKITKILNKPVGILANLRKSEPILAIARLLSGPDIPTIATPNSSYFTLSGLNGTGLAAKIGGNPKSINTTGSRTVVYISICFKGLSVSRPRSLAVLSPSQCEEKACIASCTAIEKKMTGMIMAKSLADSCIYPLVYLTLRRKTSIITP